MFRTQDVAKRRKYPLRKTKFDLIGVYKGERFINIDSQIPNKVVEEALKLKKLMLYQGFIYWKEKKNLEVLI